ncbi:hypothetical protein CMI37_05590, partial [Candidatus Pacearchaeota archaeon]|nr:hypothetical protein [Candidatus Pacearchaeota archaeon]
MLPLEKRKKRLDTMWGIVKRRYPSLTKYGEKPYDEKGNLLPQVLEEIGIIKDSKTPVRSLPPSQADEQQRMQRRARQEAATTTFVEDPRVSNEQKRNLFLEGQYMQEGLQLPSSIPALPPDPTEEDWKRMNDVMEEGLSRARFIKKEAPASARKLLQPFTSTREEPLAMRYLKPFTSTREEPLAKTVGWPVVKAVGSRVIRGLEASAETTGGLGALARSKLEGMGPTGTLPLAYSTAMKIPPATASRLGMDVPSVIEPFVHPYKPMTEHAQATLDIW